MIAWLYRIICFTKGQLLPDYTGNQSPFNTLCCHRKYFIFHCNQSITCCKKLIMLVNYAWPSYIHHAYFCYVYITGYLFCREAIFYAQTIKVKILIKVIVVKKFLIKQQQKSLIFRCEMYISCIMCQGALLICMYIFLYVIYLPKLLNN